MFYRPIAVAAAAVLTLQGCAQLTPAPVVEVDTFNEGIAKTCSFSPMQPKPGATVEATVTMTNDGWCAYRATEMQGKSYLLGLVRQRPAHGELLIRKWNGETRVEYYPVAGYIGTDSYTVVLRSNVSGTADSIVQIAATVSQGRRLQREPAVAGRDDPGCGHDDAVTRPPPRRPPQVSTGQGWCGAHRPL